MKPAHIFLYIGSLGAGQTYAADHCPIKPYEVHYAQEDGCEAGEDNPPYEQYDLPVKYHVLSDGSELAFVPACPWSDTTYAVVHFNKQCQTTLLKIDDDFLGKREIIDCYKIFFGKDPNDIFCSYDRPNKLFHLSGTTLRSIHAHTH